MAKKVEGIWLIVFARNPLQMFPFRSENVSTWRESPSRLLENSNRKESLRGSSLELKLKPCCHETPPKFISLNKLREEREIEFKLFSH